MSLCYALAPHLTLQMLENGGSTSQGFSFHKFAETWTSLLLPF